MDTRIKNVGIEVEGIGKEIEVDGDGRMKLSNWSRSMYFYPFGHFRGLIIYE